MIAGPEVDWLVSEWIFGVPRTFSRVSDPPKKIVEQVVKPYSTDMDAANEVIKNIEARGFICDLKSRGSECRCEFLSIKQVGYSREIHAYVAESFPLAICMAALKVVGADIPTFE